MSHDEMHRYFEAVLTEPPPDRTDIESAIETAHRQQRRRRTGYATVAACVLVAGVVAVAAWPGGTGTGTTTTAPGASTSADTGDAAGALVTTPEELYGVWRTMTLDGKGVLENIYGVRTPLVLTFRQHQDESWWTANDTCNDQFGTFTVDGGRLLAVGSGTTLVGCSPSSVRERNAQVVKEADQARITPASADEPRKLSLMHDGVVIGTYEYQPMGWVSGTFELVGGPITPEGKTPHNPARAEGISLRDKGGAVVADSTDQQGRFTLQAPVGTYTLVTDLGCPAPVKVTVTEGHTTDVDLVCPVP